MPTKKPKGSKRSKAKSSNAGEGRVASKLTLNSLSPHPLASHRRKRIGRGESSGWGKTAGRGGKGQTARSGSGGRADFEGGQMPIHRRLPKFGFNSMRDVRRSAIINVQDLEKFSDVSVIDLKFLQDKGIVHGAVKVLRVLGKGDLKSSLTIKAQYFSASAKKKIESAKGKAEVA